MFSLLEWEAEVLYWLSTHRTEFIDSLVKGFNFIGDELFFSLMLPLLYWLWSKRTGFKLAIVLFVSFYCNVLIKDFAQVLRPFQAYSHIIPLVDQHGYSFPSGHAMHSFSVWGFLAISIRKTWFYILAILMVVSIGFARMYSGVHFMRDVLVGWLCAAIIISIVVIGARLLQHRTLHNGLLIVLGTFLPFIAIQFYELVTEGSLDQKGAYQACGLIMFSVFAYIWEKEKIRFIIPTKWSSRFIACFIGLVGIFALKEGVKLLLPSHVWADFIRYGLIGFWTIALAPYLFVKLKLYEKEQA